MLHQKLYLYEDRTDVTLTTYINENSLCFLPALRRPAILICPGGAYLTCADGEGEPVAMAFNAMGYNAFVLRYSTYFRGGAPQMGGELSAREHCLFPNPMLDIGKAMQTITENADDWHVDPEQLVLCGFSAGAHNCGMYSVYWKEYGFPQPKAAILGYCLGDYRLQLWPGMDEGAKAMLHMSNIAICGKPEMDEETMQRLSIPTHVSEDTPPLFLWNTAEDEQVPASQTLLIAGAMLKHHRPVEVHMFEEGFHGLSVANESSALIGSQVRPEIAAWTELAHTWLKKRLKITLPEKMPF